MTISVGEKMPSGTLMTLGEGAPEPVATDEFFSGRKVVLFGLPGAFTPTCSAQHVPSYVENHTALAAKVGIAGSSTIGSYCMLGGAVGVAGHLEITDKVMITGMTLVTRSIREPGTYSSGWPVATSGEWRKQVARLRRLGKLEDRVKQLESGA